MKIIKGIENFRPCLPSSVVTFGSFDGLHAGHRALFKKAFEWGQKLGAPVVVVTFHPHPLTVLRPGTEVPRIHGLRDLKLELEKMGTVDYLLVEPFTEKLAYTSASEYFEGQLWPVLRPRAVVVGYDFVFGANRSGDQAYLKKVGKEKDFILQVVEAVNFDGEIISSSRIRGCLAKGDLARAKELLGQPYRVTGLVAKGDQRGRKLGFPTANVVPDFEPAMALGVYLCKCSLGSEQYFAVTNVGRAPTFKENGAVTIECYILDFSKDIYGQEITVEFVGFLRSEKKFSGAEDLIAQIKKDEAQARELLKGQ